MIDASDSTEMNPDTSIPDELKALTIHTFFADPRDKGELAAVIERLEGIRDRLPLGHEEATAILLVTTEALRFARHRRGQAEPGDILMAAAVAIETAEELLSGRLRIDGVAPVQESGRCLRSCPPSGDLWQTARDRRQFAAMRRRAEGRSSPRGSRTGNREADGASR